MLAKLIDETSAKGKMPNALKKQNNGLAVVTTKKDGSVYTKYFQFWNINKADKYFTEQLGFKKL